MNERKGFAGKAKVWKQSIFYKTHVKGSLKVNFKENMLDAFFHELESSTFDVCHYQNNVFHCHVRMQTNEKGGTFLNN